MVFHTGGKPLDVNLGRAALALTDALNQAESFADIQFHQQLGGTIVPAVHALLDLFQRIVDIYPSLSCQPFQSDRPIRSNTGLYSSLTSVDNLLKHLS